jgi:hypothetical protein
MIPVLSLYYIRGRVYSRTDKQRDIFGFYNIGKFDNQLIKNELFIHLNIIR